MKHDANVKNIPHFIQLKIVSVSLNKIYYHVNLVGINGEKKVDIQVHAHLALAYPKNMVIRLENIIEWALWISNTHMFQIVSQGKVLIQEASRKKKKTIWAQCRRPMQIET